MRGRGISLTAFLRDDRRGVAAIEFGVFALVLIVAIVNVADVGMYTYDKMEVANASQIGVQAAWQTCDTTKLPATVNCSGLSSAISAAVGSTSLGGNVTVVSGYPAEAYYCVTGTSTLQFVGSTSNKPANCAAAGSASTQPADYIQIEVSYSYTSLFPGLSVAGLLTTPIQRTAWMRLS